jgi:prolyl oligopeptidase PreP (S9A serine peptidase family)
VHSEEVEEFIVAQRKLTDSVLSHCDLRRNFHDKITTLFDFPRFGCPFKKGNKYFYFHNTGLQAQSVLYVQVSTPSLKVWIISLLLFPVINVVMKILYACMFGYV